MLQNQLKYSSKYPQSFTGKERDSETGFSYFGARYYDSDLMTGWLSVDPMADKYPSLSPYAYCALNPIKIVDPNGDTITVTNKNNVFLFSLDNGNAENIKYTAKELYDKGIQWSEPNADNYMPLIEINSNIEDIEGIDHFSWKDIENFALTDRLMIDYREGGSGDFKKDKTFLCTVDGIPYWTDIIGQIPFAINCYKNQLMKGKSHNQATEYTKSIGHLFSNGLPSIDLKPNNADNWMIQRVCNWAKKGFSVGSQKKCGRFVYNQIVRTSYKFNNLSQWKRQ